MYEPWALVRLFFDTVGFAPFALDRPPPTVVAAFAVRFCGATTSGVSSPPVDGCCTAAVVIVVVIGRIMTIAGGGGVNDADMVVAVAVVSGRGGGVVRNRAHLPVCQPGCSVSAATTGSDTLLAQRIATRSDSCTGRKQLSDGSGHSNTRIRLADWPSSVTSTKGVPLARRSVRIGWVSMAGTIRSNGVLLADCWKHGNGRGIVVRSAGSDEEDDVVRRFGCCCCNGRR